ncbi:hypothetical protein [Altererythrobacter sp. ZODW24]|uniref:hypothetical protein n=1 Tax=Altererythrobacter sp. ZODW24 TaxID=2185142 RepID=UPI0013B476D5|nr:hypothetical protein [Altererythrobacter sp. ZODW24]
MKIMELNIAEIELVNGAGPAEDGQAAGEAFAEKVEDFFEAVGDAIGDAVDTVKSWF